MALALTIIVPICDEAGALPGLLRHLAPLRGRGCEVIVVDGGSRDGGPALVRAAGVRLLRTAPGRARQMHAGALAAQGAVLLFLHVDTRLPRLADYRIIAAMRRHQRPWGRFDVYLAAPRSYLLRTVAGLINLRSLWTGIATGDQALFISRQLYHALGGFPDQPLMEDVAMTIRLRRRSPPLCLACRAVTSARRWQQHGAWSTILLMWRLRLAYACGVPATALASVYHRRPRENGTSNDER